MITGNLLVRADASCEIGIGHIMRCFALAQEWRQQGGAVVFLSNCDNCSIIKKISSEGFRYIQLSESFPDSVDFLTTKMVLNELGDNTWLVLDGYHFGQEYFEKIRELKNPCLVMDDYNHIPYYQTDIVLNQNIDAEGLGYKLADHTVALLGCKYVMLRKQFLLYERYNKKIKEKAVNILITMGGSDSGNVSLNIIKMLNLLNDPELNVCIVLGPSNIHQDSLIKELSLSPFKGKLLVSVKNMPDLMAWADLAITAGGSTCWELCFMGVPSFVVWTAMNQKHVVNGLNNHQIFTTLGWWEKIDIEKYSIEIQRLMVDKDQRLRMSKLGKNLIDGFGRSRVVRSMVDLIQ